MKNEKAKNLYNKYLEGNCNPTEKAIVESWLNELMSSNDDAPGEKEFLDAKARIYDRVKKNGAPVPPVARTIKFSFLRIAAVASVTVAVLGIGGYFFAKDPLPTNYSNDIDPGSTKAILVLANGKEIILNDAKSGEIAEQKGVKITKSKEGQLVYDATSVTLPSTNTVTENKISPTTSEISGTPASSGDTGGLNAVKTPRGGQYEIILPDGTKVWLNAASSLKFPSTFLNLGERRVELIGEAYFEVAHVTATLLGKQRKSKRIPFIVQTPQQEVRVLGTHFNINCYKDEPDTKTTLLEGSVMVSTPDSWYSNSSTYVSKPVGVPERGVKKILKPGEQSINTGSNINVIDADTEQAIAWKNGEFSFRNEVLESIMRKISRWYDVEVVYENRQETANRAFGGTISKFSKVSDVLSMLELTGQVKFKVKGRKITVTK